MRMRKKKNLIPRMNRCGDYLISDPYERAGHWRELMPEAREIRLEVGCGKGRFTAGTAVAEPDVLLIAIEVVPEAIVVAMERCADRNLHNVFFIDADANQIPYFFAPEEIDRIYINFCDPWPSKRHAKRRLTHGNFLKLYRKILSMGAEIHFKTDNQPLFDFSIEEFPQFGFVLSEVTRNLHENGPVGVMTDYEKKFHEQGQPIYRCVASMIPWEEPFPDNIKTIKSRWLNSFAIDIPESELKNHVLSAGNFLWHIFSWKLTSCLEGDSAREALANLPDENFYLFYCEYPPENMPPVRLISKSDALNLPETNHLFGADWYLTDKNFSWTYAHPHELDLGPYFCKSKF